MTVIRGVLLSISLLTSAAVCGPATTCDQPFQANVRSGSVLALDLRAGDIDIIGTDTLVVRVSCEAPNREELRDISVSFESSGPSSKLRVSGGPTNEVRIRIEVPRNTHLSVKGTAGNMRIDGIRGDKDVQLKAGDLSIAVGDPADYASVDASVNAGDLDASAFGVRKGGLFRSFHKSQKNGSYTLRARLWAGNVTLE
jgi:hypothetical protein